MVKLHKYTKGFTLGEILIVVAIIAIAAILLFTNFKNQIVRGNDSKRKTDLAALKVVFEDYYNDHNCYPKKVLWDQYDCATRTNGDFLKPYLGGKDIPCDPQTNERYLYITIPEDEADSCTGYHLLAALGDLKDPDIVSSGCDPSPMRGCGFEPYKYNYGISMGGIIANPSFDFSAPIPTPTPGYPQGNWVCTPNSIICQNVTSGCRSAVETAGCSTYADAGVCTGLCILGRNTCAPFRLLPECQ